MAIVTPDFTTVPDPQDCCPCSTCDAGTIGTSLQSIHLNIGLGGDNFDGSAGALTLGADQPTLALATPSALRYSVASSVELISDSSTNHLQFKTSQALANILTNNAYKYTVSLFTAADAGAKDETGFYQPTGTAFTTVVIENPDASNTVYNRLRITRTADSSSSVTDYIYGSTNGQWEMHTGGGLRKETRVSVWDTNNTVRTETVAVSNATNQLVYKEINTYQRFPWGQERIQNVVDPDGAALTNTWTFYTNSVSDGGNYRKLKQEVDTKGNWATYQYDQEGRETNRVTQFLNSATGSAASSNRATTTSYSTNAPQITIIETLLGTEIGREYKVVGPGEVDNYRCQTPGAAWNAADNLLTITKKYTTGSFAGRLQRVRNPDSTVELYSYATNATQMTTTVLSGVPDPNNTTNILDGTKTITVTALGGKILSGTVAYVVAGSGDVTTDQDTYTYLDDRNRSYQVVHLDGTTNSFYYACCGLESEVDRDGTTTQYFYDDLKRQTATLRNGITTTNALDAADHVKATIRIGTNGSWNTLHQTGYDVAGRVTTQTNALTGITTFSEGIGANGYFVKTNIFPDTGTRIESYFKDGSLAKLTGTAVHPVRYTNSVELESSTNRFFTQEIKLDASGNDTSEWTKTYYDTLKRPYKTVFAKSTSPYPYSQSFYNAQGQLWKQIDPDGVASLYQYNPKGELAYSALDTNRDGTINFAGNDRITWTTNYVTTNNGTTVRRTQTYVWPSGTDASNLVSTVEASADGLRTWNTIWNAGTGVTNQTRTVYSTGGNRYVTNTAPDNSYTVSAFSYGRPSTVTRYSSTGSQLGKTTYAYDAHGRVLTTTDARNGATNYGYNNADQLRSVTTPPPGTGQGPQTTTTYFDNMGRATNVFLADLTTVNNEYSLSGALKRTFGSRTYPVGYGYDAQGRMKTMTNWTGFAASTGTRVTTWNYDGYRGFLTNKVYDGGSAGPSYAYTPAGRLQTRAWARGITTTNSYNNNGNLSSVSYSDTTPSVAMVYDRRGRATTVTNGTAVCALAYNDANQLLSETNSAGTSAGLWVTNTYDSYLRRTSLSAQNSSTPLLQHSFAFDNASRLTNVTDGTYSAGYTYLANSPLISQITFRQIGSTKMTTTKQYDYLNRLLSISSAPSASGQLPLAYAYAYNDANQRTRLSLNDGSFWIYQYDSLGQVTSGKKYWSDGSPVPGQQFEYGFDDIGNRASSKAGGDAVGSALRAATYSANSLNQYTNRTVPSAFDAIGIANVSASVTVNSSSADYRRGEYFQELVSVSNSSTSVWQNVSVTTSGGGTNTGSVFVPSSSESYGYDADGNQTNDGRWTFTWDGENRLLSIQAVGTVPSAAKKKLDFTYDYGGRRIQKIVSAWNGSAYVAASTNKFLYDAWNLIAELNGTNGVIRSYLWGTDLSGQAPLLGGAGGGLQGAGGVGGLLAIKPTGTNTLFVAYDGNGNVTGLIDATTGTTSGQFEYSPFGETIRLTPNANNQSPFRFSTKYQDDESDFLYYGFRYYNPSAGRWLNRDPIGELGGINLSGFVGNNPLTYFDKNGREYVDGNSGKWTIEVQAEENYFTGERPVVTAEYIMSKSQAKCCKRVRIDRYARPWFTSLFPRRWRPDPARDPGMTGDEGGSIERPATSDPDQPGIQVPVLRHLFPFVSDFEWRAVCVAGPDTGKVLSVTRRRYILLGNSGTLQ